MVIDQQPLVRRLDRRPEQRDPPGSAKREAALEALAAFIAEPFAMSGWKVTRAPLVADRGR